MGHFATNASFIWIAVKWIPLLKVFKFLELCLTDTKDALKLSEKNDI